MATSATEGQPASGAIGRAWRHRDLRVLMIGEGVSMFGSLVSRLALPWTASRELGKGTLAVGLVFLVELVPAVVVGLFAGALVDRWPRRRVLVITNVIQAIVTMVVPVLAWRHRLGLPAIYAVGAITGCVVPFFRAAFRSSVPVVVPRPDLAGAQSIVQGVSAAAELVAFASAGWLVHAFGGPSGLAVDAFTFVWAAGGAALLRPIPPALRRAHRTNVFDELRQGIAIVRRDAVLGPLALAGLIVSIGTGIAGSVYVVHVTKTLGYATGPQGLVYSVGAVGSLLGAWIAPRALARLGLSRSMVASMLVTVPAGALVGWAGRPSLRGYSMLVTQQAVADPVQTVGIVANGTLVAAASPEHMRGRIESTMLVTSTLGMAVGYFVGGVLGERARLGTTTMLLGSGIAGIVGVLVLRRSAVGSVHSTDDVSPTVVPAVGDAVLTP